MTTEQLVRAVYPALATGDREALFELLDPEFEGTLTESLPGGGVHRGARAMIEDGWWSIGRAYAIRAEPREWIPCPDGRLLVLGRYVGRARATGAPLDAAFVHVWSASGGRLSAIWQLTDSALWLRALES